MSELLVLLCYTIAKAIKKEKKFFFSQIALDTVDWCLISWEQLILLGSRYPRMKGKLQQRTTEMQLVMGVSYYSEYNLSSDKLAMERAYFFLHSKNLLCLGGVEGEVHLTYVWCIM